MAATVIQNGRVASSIRQTVKAHAKSPPATTSSTKKAGPEPVTAAITVSTTTLATMPVPQARRARRCFGMGRSSSAPA